MFRIITLDTPLPKLFLLCDSRSCGEAAGADATGTAQADVDTAVQVFLTKVRLEGWQLGLDGHFCGNCTRRTKEAAARRQERQEAEKQQDKPRPLVQVANPMQQKMAERAVERAVGRTVQLEIVKS